MTPYKVKELHPNLYSLYEQTDVYCYLIMGAKSALLYDTTFGVCDLAATVRALTPLPVEVMLSHGHYDHVNGAFQFDGAYIHPADEILCYKHAGRTCRRWSLNDEYFSTLMPPELDHEAYIHAGAGKLTCIQPGHTFDLGGLTVEVVALEGHTAGSIGLLIHEHHILLASDALGPHNWLFLKESLPIPQYLAMLRRIQALPFDTFFIGHSDLPRPKAEIALYEQVARNINPAQSTPYPRLPELGGYFYEEKHDGESIGVVYHPDKLK